MTATSFGRSLSRLYSAPIAVALALGGYSGGSSLITVCLVAAATILMAWWAFASEP